MFRWQRHHWVISDLGSDERRDFEESRWLYAVPNSDDTPPLTGWETRSGVGPPPSLTRGTRSEAAAHDIEHGPPESSQCSKCLQPWGEWSGPRSNTRCRRCKMCPQCYATHPCAAVERIGGGSWQSPSPVVSRGPGELPSSAERRKPRPRGHFVAAPAPRQTPEDRARIQLECIQTFYAEALQGTEVPHDLAARLTKPNTPFEATEFEQLCATLGQKHKVNADPRFWTGPVVKQGWLFKRAGNWDFWHKYFAVVRGSCLTFFTVENPLEELDAQQLRWHTDPKRRIDLKLCQAVLPPTPTAGDASPEEATADFRIAGAQLATGHLELRCDSPAEASAWVECMKTVCPEQAEAQPEPEPEPELHQGNHQMGRTSSLGQRIRERTYSREAAPALVAADPNPAPVLASTGPVVLDRPEGQDLIRQMSDTEKQRLVASLETLPREEIDRVVAIVQEHTAAGAEIDLDQLPLAALWRIKSLVDGAAAAAAAAGTPGAPEAGAVYTWQWNNDGVWQAYDEGLQAELRAAHLRGVANGVGESVAVMIGRFTYRISLSTMTQQNLETGNVRQIRMLTAGDDPTEGNAPPQAAPRSRRPPGPTEAQIGQLRELTRATADACRDAFRRAGGNLDIAVGILVEGSSAGDGAPPMLAADGSPMPSHDEMIHAIWSQLVPEGRSMGFEEMCRFLHVLNEVEGGDEELTQEEWNDMCEQHGVDRTTGLTEAEFRDLIFDDLDPTDRREMRELFKMYEQVVLAPQRERIPDGAAAGTPPTRHDAAPTLPIQAADPVAPARLLEPGEIRVTFDQPGRMGIGFTLQARSILDLLPVEEVDPGSPAAQAGVRPGFRLRSIDRTSVSGISDDTVLRLVQSRPCTLIFVDPDVPPQPLGLPPARAAPHPGEPVRLAAGGDGDLESRLDILQDMGFSRREASRALEIAHDSVERAAMLLSTGELAEMMSDDDSDDGDGVARLGSLGSMLSSSGSDESGDEEGLPWRTRDQFTDDEQYGAYIEATLRVGMRVRARCHAEHTIETGDEGVYLQTNGGEPPCQVRWDGYGGTFWVQWYHVEIIQPADDVGQDADTGAQMAAEEPGVNEAMVQQLVSFGFDATQAATALERVGGDLNAALDLLSAGM